MSQILLFHAHHLVVSLWSVGSFVDLQEKETNIPIISNVKITTSAKSVEHKNGVSLFKHLEISSLIECK